MSHPFIENSVNLHSDEKYTAIIGESPSKGARSPLLWNAAYDHYQMGIKMYPFDVLPENLIYLLDYLNKNKNFLGGAIAVPYKEKVSEWLENNQSSQVAKIGAVNCIGRNKDGNLFGYNTDGEASILSFEKKFGPVTGKSVLILGCGGSAKAVSTYFKEHTGTKGKITIASRSQLGEIFANKIDVNWVDWNDLNSVLPKINLVINCTPVGHGIQSNESPLSYEQLSLLPRNSIVYDIIYQVNPNKLLAYASEQKLSSMDGSDMNIQQAVVAFCNTNQDVQINLETTKIAMLKILNSKT